jgi:hypothetical protein
MSVSTTVDTCNDPVPVDERVKQGYLLAFKVYDSLSGGGGGVRTQATVLEFLNNLWGPGTKKNRVLVQAT